ncbi:MAG: penicillin-binding transpeptidase domain-containing protein, partial [Pseudomonadota bacterium]|nr:penicillin-binding transpeptidase domain-containing protein [Pseudomonadota bacterium]
IGSAQLAFSVSPEVHWGFLERLGLIDKPELEIPELTKPQLPRQWGEVERATSSYGYGISISPLQALVAGSAMVNGGVMYRPRLINDDLPLGVRVISEETSNHMRQIMRAVVTHGTAKNAKKSKFKILGKTGTARMAGQGGYDNNRLMTSFLGAFPAHAPRYAFIVILQEPQQVDGVSGAGAGWNVVPLSTDIVERIAPLLGVMPQQENMPGDNGYVVHKAKEVL